MRSRCCFTDGPTSPQQKTSSRKQHPSSLLIVVLHVLKQLMIQNSPVPHCSGTWGMFLQKYFFERSFTHCRPALFLHWAPRHIPPPLGTGISRLSSVPSIAFPAGKGRLLQGAARLAQAECTEPGQGGPVPAAPAAQAGAAPGLRVDANPAPLNGARAAFSTGAGAGAAGREQDRLHGTAAVKLEGWDLDRLMGTVLMSELTERP